MKSIFITGGTSGIGAELAKIYLDRGYRVGVCGRDASKFQESFPEKIENLFFYPLDVMEREELKKVISNFSQGHTLDIVVANAGIATGEKKSIPNFDKVYKVLDINIKGVVHTFEAALEIMFKQKSGQLVAVSSVAGFNGLPGVSAYSASKAAVIKFCESFHLDMRNFGISVSVVAPGFVQTAFVKNNNHKMPFMMSASEAARRMVKGMDKKKFMISFPFRMYLICRFFEILPRRCYMSIMKLKLFNYSKQ